MNSHQSDARSAKDMATQFVAKGDALASAGQTVESIGSYAEAVKLDPSPQTYWYLLRAQMGAQRFEEAYGTCKAAIKLAPHEPALYQLFANLKRRLGHGAAAKEVLSNAAAMFPDNAELAWECGLAHFQANEPAEAVPMFERVVALKPNADAYRTLLKARQRLGDSAGARQVALDGRAHFPLDVRLASYCGVFRQFPAEALSRKAMREALPRLKKAAARTEIYRFLAYAQARDNRVAAGGSAQGAGSWSDLARWSDPAGMAEFVASLDDELSSPGARAEAIVERGAAAVAQMDWSGAERWFAQLRRQPIGTVADVTTFDLAFYAALETSSDQDLWAAFPHITEVVARGTWPAAMTYVACDPKFFELYVPRLLKSFVSTGTTVGVHVHLMDGTEETWARLADVLRSYEGLSVSMTAETGARERYGARARDYYHAARYVRFYQYLVQHRRPVWILDADMAAEADCGPLFDMLGPYEFAAATSAITLEPWAKIKAGIVGVAPTAAGLRYSRLVAAYIAHWYAKGGLRWGIDQQALFGAYYYLEHLGCAPKALFMGEQYTNDSDDLPCVIRPILDADRWKKTV